MTHLAKTTKNAKKNNNNNNKENPRPGVTQSSVYVVTIETILARMNIKLGICVQLEVLSDTAVKGNESTVSWHESLI